MKNLIYVISIMIIFLVCVADQQETPNIVFIIADDMSWDDTSVYGHPDIKTPNLEKLANQGMRFDQAFLTTSSCSPSRASIITGKYPHSTDAEQLHWPLPADQITFVEKLREAGYWTGQAGKWHLGDAVRDRFDVIMDVSTSGFQLSSEGEQMVQQENKSGSRDWLELLRSRPENKPFFLWLASLDPHRDYENDIIDDTHSTDEVRMPPYLPDTEEVREDLALYYDEITRLDSYVGKVMDELERQGVAENTLVLFISDNGRPFPRDKTTLYDGGIKTPWIVRWPGHIKSGTYSESLVSVIDIAPTFLKLAGIDPGSQFRGRDFSPILQNPERTIRDFIYAEDHWHDFEDFTRAVRTRRFKYIRNFYPDLPNTPPADALRSPTFQQMRELKDAGSLTEAQRSVFKAPRPEEELYDVKNDSFELNNLASDPAYADTLDKMRHLMEQIRSQTNDSIPEERTPDEFDRETGEPNEFRIRPRPSKAEMKDS